MHIAGACVFDDPPPPFEDLERLVASNLHLIPRYRQRVRSVPFELGRPVWVDDPHFDLGYHLRHTALPTPGDDAAFDRLMGRLMSQPLDRERPLWEGWLVEGLEGGKWALVFKIHHCICLLYTSDAADEEDSVDLGGRRIIKKKKKINKRKKK